MTKQEKVIGYIRVESLKEDVAESIKKQMGRIQLYADIKDYNVEYIYADLAQIGPVADTREKFREIVTDAKKKQWTKILITGWDRLGSKPEFIEARRKMLEDVGLEIVLV